MACAFTGNFEDSTWGLRSAMTEVVQRYEAALRNNGYDDPQSLATASPKELLGMGIPLRFAKDLVTAAAIGVDGPGVGGGKPEQGLEESPVIKALTAIDHKQLKLQRQYAEECNELMQQHTKQQAALLEERKRIYAAGLASSREEGSKDYWMEAMRRHPPFEEYIQEWDEPVLEYLVDIKKSSLDAPNQGFKLLLSFAENPFFTNSKLTIEYHTHGANPYSGDLTTQKTIVDEIDWNAGKNVTVEKATKRVEGADYAEEGKKEEFRPSFFRNFSRHEERYTSKAEPQQERHFRSVLLKYGLRRSVCYHGPLPEEEESRPSAAVPEQVELTSAEPPAPRPLPEEEEPRPSAAVPEQVALTPAEPPAPVALLFPGQGSQYVKMMTLIKDLPAIRDYRAKAKTILGWDAVDLCLNGPEKKLDETKYCQPVMFIAGMAGLEKLRLEHEKAVTHFQCTAGLGIGEYTALCAAGVFSFEDGLELVKLCGEAMQEAGAACRQASIHVAGLPMDVVEQLCKDSVKKHGSSAVCQIAMELFPNGAACSGTEQAILALKEMSEKAGALQAKIIKMPGGAHTPLMAPAQEKVSRALDAMLPGMAPPRRAVYMTASAAPLEPGTDPTEVVALLKQELVSPVLWERSVRAMVRDGITEFYEVGPMKHIKAIMKRIDNEMWAKTMNVEV